MSVSLRHHLTHYFSPSKVDLTVDKLAAELEATEPLLPNTGSNEVRVKLISRENRVFRVESNYAFGVLVMSDTVPLRLWSSLLCFCLFVQYGLEQYDEEDGRRRLRRQRRMLAGAKKMNENDVIRKAMEILRSGDNFELVGAWDISLNVSFSFLHSRWYEYTRIKCCLPFRQFNWFQAHLSSVSHESPVFFMWLQVTEHHATELKFCINLLGRYTKRYGNTDSAFVRSRLFESKLESPSPRLLHSSHGFELWILKSSSGTPTLPSTAKQSSRTFASTIRWTYMKTFVLSYLFCFVSSYYWKFRTELLRLLH